MTDDGGVLLVHAHPDDEAFGSGGLIARSVAEGRRVDLVTCTGGEEGEIHDPTLDEAEAKPRLREIRHAELQCALDALRGDGPGTLELHLLGYRDSGMMGTESNANPEAFWNADLDEATGRLVAIVRRTRPAVMVSYDSNGNYGHPDHINAYRIADGAWEAAADPKRYPEAGPPHAVGKLYEIAFNRDRWMALMNDMKERGIELPWGGDEEESESASETEEEWGVAPGPAHDRAGCRCLRRPEARLHGLPQDPAAGHGLAARPAGRPPGARPLARVLRAAQVAGPGGPGGPPGDIGLRLRLARTIRRMAKGSIGLDEALNDYIQRVGVREHPVLARLRERTSTMENARMQISPDEGAFLQMLVRLLPARRVLEVGTFTGYSSTAMALAQDADDRIVCCDVSKEWTDIAREAWTEAGVADRIELRLAPAVETLDGLLADGQGSQFDMAFIDADKGNYDNYYERALQLVRPGGLIAIDNVLWSGRVVDASDQEADTQAIRALNEKIATDERVDLAMTPIADGVTLARVR